MEEYWSERGFRKVNKDWFDPKGRKVVEWEGFHRLGSQFQERT